METRCPWCGDDPLYIAYHDAEWGVPEHNDRNLFEFLLLEGAQAGLSWITVLRKRENYRQAFDHFDYEKIARYDEKKITALLQDAGIIRNKLKIAAAVSNAQAFSRVIDTFGSFDSFIWRYVDGTPRDNGWDDIRLIPTQTPDSERMSRDLGKLGFRFIGPTICYAFMQAVGMVNDHITACFRHREIAGLNQRGC